VGAEALSESSDVGVAITSRGDSSVDKLSSGAVVVGPVLVRRMAEAGIRSSSEMVS